MQCNYNSFMPIINFHGLFRNALRCRENWCLPNTGALTVHYTNTRFPYRSCGEHILCKLMRCVLESD